MVKETDSAILGLKGVGTKGSHTQLSPRHDTIVSGMTGRRKQENDVACCKHEFCKNNIPPKRTKSTVPGPIHFCIAAGELGILEELKPLLKSLVLHAKRTDIILHILTGNDSEREIRNILERIPDTPVKFMYDLVRLNRTYIISESLKNNIAISHHSGVWGMSKAYMHEIFKNVKKCIVLDVDTVFGTDPAFLWDEFSNLEDQQAISMRITNKSEKYTMINSGVMLQDFEKLRKIHFSKFYLSAAKMGQCSHSPDESGLRFKCSDQALTFGIYKNNNSHFFQTLQVCWNLEKCLGFGFYKFQRYVDSLGIFFGLVHLNCLRGENKALMMFLKDYQLGKLNEYLNYLISVPLENICSA
ncbi:hypothetical protein ACJMK2_031404 [Sinanodonta woodiana]|uniref:Glycosyltransferase n=1 Tax=Sinanodonta woodiana TaxID=1069815 RepID=A0ABD3X044_SINWO